MPQAAALTLEDYFAFEMKAEGRHEFVDGKIVAMAYASEPHGKIASNLLRLLGNCLLSKDCDVYAGDRMVFVKDCNQVFYPAHSSRLRLLLRQDYGGSKDFGG